MAPGVGASGWELTQRAEVNLASSDTLHAQLSGRKQKQQGKKDANFIQVVGSAGALGVLLPGHALQRIGDLWTTLSSQVSSPHCMRTHSLKHLPNYPHPSPLPSTAVSMSSTSPAPSCLPPPLSGALSEGPDHTAQQLRNLWRMDYQAAIK